jgi:fatty-acyl-CoA synthase
MRKLGSAGKPYPYVEVDVGEDGELLVRGPNVFPGYWRNPEATAETLRDGWLHTGDVVERDDEGYFYVKGRLKEMFISGGENVYPAEIESVLHEHPHVRDAAVVGVPDERWGEVGAAYVVLDGAVTGDELIELCRARLARFKVPKSVHVVDELPRNSLGKIQKSELGRVPA